MKNLLTFSGAILVSLVLLASQCKDNIGNVLPDINTDIAQEFPVASADQQAEGELVIDPNTNGDFRSNKDKLKFVTVTQVNFNVVTGTIVTDRKILITEVLFKHPDSAKYQSLGQVTNLKLSEMVNAVRLPSSATALNNLSNLALTSTKGVKLKYKFLADAPGINFTGRAQLKLVLKLQ